MQADIRIKTRYPLFYSRFFGSHSNEGIDKSGHLFDGPGFYLLKSVDNGRCQVVVFRSCPREQIKQLKIIVDMQSC